MVAVVVGLEPGKRLRWRGIQRRGQCVDVGRHLTAQLVLRDAADGGEAGVEADVLQVVKLAEDGQLAELGDAGEEDEAQELVACLERCEKFAHDHAELAELLGVVRHVEKRGVVLVDEDDGLLAGLGCGGLDERHEARAGGDIAVVSAPSLLKVAQDDIEQLRKLTGVLGLHGGEVHADDGVRLPLGFHLRNREAVEEFAASLEIRLHGGEQQRLAEAARTTQEVSLSRSMRKRIDKRCLVDVEIPVLANVAERLNPNWIPACCSRLAHLLCPPV